MSERLINPKAPGLVLSRTDAMRAAMAAQKRGVNHITSDDFASRKVVQEQLDDLEAYITERRKTDPEFHLPKPLGWRISVLMITIPEATDGGLIIADQDREARSLASPQGVVLGLGSNAYQDPARFALAGDSAPTPWLAVGDRIQFVKYDAQPFQLANGQRIGVLTDTQPVALIDKGWEVPN